MQGLKGVIASAPAIENLLEAWVVAVQRYTELFKGDDCCWWYNERANVSVLAGAAWTLGWAALEECPTEKHPFQVSGTETDEALRRGRIDLYISTQDEGLTFEAKQVWQRLPGESNVPDGRRAARNAALQIQRHTTDKRYAATFIVPFFASDEEVSSEQLNAWIQSQIATLTGEAESCGYYFPTLGPGQLVNYRGFTYPGVMLVIEDVTG